MIMLDKNGKRLRGAALKARLARLGLPPQECPGCDDPMCHKYTGRRIHTVCYDEMPGKPVVQMKLPVIEPPDIRGFAVPHVSKDDVWAKAMRLFRTDIFNMFNRQHMRDQGYDPYNTAPNYMRIKS